MKPLENSRREFLSKIAIVSSAGIVRAKMRWLPNALINDRRNASDGLLEGAADYTLRIGAAAVEIGKKTIVSAVTYNGHFPGPLLRFKEGHPVVSGSSGCA